MSISTVLGLSPGASIHYVRQRSQTVELESSKDAKDQDAAVDHSGPA